MNNKFGKCCSCPARMDFVADFADFRSPSVVFSESFQKSGMTIHDYNQYLEDNGEELIKYNIEQLKSGYVCKNDGTNMFLINTSDYHDRFDQINSTIEDKGVRPYNPHERKQLTVSDTRTAYAFKDINTRIPRGKYSFTRGATGGMC